jgi:cell division protein FtsA
MSKGVVTDLQELSQSIKSAVEDIYLKTGISVTSVIATMPEVMIEVQQLTGMANITPDQNNERRVTPDDIQLVTQNALQLRGLPADRQIVDMVSDEFVIDQFGNIKSPMGMIGAILEIHATSYIAPTMISDGIRSAIRNAGLTLEQFSIPSLAVETTVLSDEDKRDGVFLIDFGADHTSVSIVVNEEVIAILDVPQGGNRVTSDIVAVLNETFPEIGIDFAQAETLKTTNGQADPLTVNPEKLLDVTSLVDGQIKKISAKFMSEIIEARLQETIETLYQQIANFYSGVIPNYPVVISGGASALNGINELVAQLMNRKSTLYVPSEIGARHPGWTNAISITHMFAGQKSTERIIKDTLNSVNASMNAVSVSNNSQISQQMFNQSMENMQTRSTNKSRGNGLFAKIRSFLGNIFE